MQMYRIYGRDKGSKQRFKPLGSQGGDLCFVVNLIYALNWDDKDIVEAKCKELNDMNETLEFEVRKVK